MSGLNLSKKFFHARHQSGNTEWLFQKTRLHLGNGARDFFVMRIAGNEENRRHVAFQSQFSHERDAIHAGEFVIANDEAERFLLQNFERFLGACSGANVRNPLVLENLAHKVADILFVVDDQD